jgi:isoamylase
MVPSKIWHGAPYPLGATWQEQGVNFSLFSEHATAVDLVLFDNVEDERERVRIRMNQQTDQVWHCFIPDLKPGQLYGYRVEGPYRPLEGLRFNPTNLLIDPYAKAIAGPVIWGDELFGYRIGSPQEDLEMDTRDDAAGVPKSVVINSSFDWGTDAPPRTPMSKTIIYECHVKGFSQLWKELPEELRGTYAGIGSSSAIEYFKKLGVTAVELLPVHQHVDDRHLVENGLTNYWGYNTIGFFAPHYEYSSSGVRGEQVVEFKSMVKALHAAGIEVILDVVYNHTAEGNHLGPTLSFKGIDNLVYYRLVEDQKRFYMDYTGTGNTLNASQPRCLQLIMDSLRYWVLEMHVDGFRFDLAPALARELHAVSRLSSFFDVIHQDPVISQVKLIAEPWDVGEGGYQVGNFPVLWSEWNGKYRDTVRKFWKGEGTVRKLAYRFSGSSDLYQGWGKTPTASVNFVTSHDGFTMWDLVSYNDKHNEANGEGGNDGDNHNNSWNCGAEGLTDDERVNRLRWKQVRNFFTTLMLSQGVPMITAGDEYGKTQQGNNNAYCQDNEISWLKWERADEERELFGFVSKLIEFRKAHPVFSRPNFFKGRKIRGSDVKDIMWLNCTGMEMTNEEWDSGHIRCLGVMLSGNMGDVTDYYGNRITDDTFLVCFNAHHEAVEFVLPQTKKMSWSLILDTSCDTGFLKQPQTGLGDRLTLDARSLAVFTLVKGDGSVDEMSDYVKATTKYSID